VLILQKEEKNELNPWVSFDHAFVQN